MFISLKIILEIEIKHIDIYSKFKAKTDRNNTI